MRKANISLFFILAYFTANAVLAQFSTGDQKKIDSLNAIIANKRSHDTSILSAYVNLSDIFYVSNPDTLIPICKIVEKKANLLLSKQPSVTVQKSINASLASALNNIGVVHQIKGEMNLALAYYLKSLNTALKTDDKQGIAATYNNIGHMYSNLGDIPLALLNHNKGLKIFGLDGSQKYSRGLHQYSEQEMNSKIMKNIFYLGFGHLDIVLSHSPPRHIHDKDDFTHRGFEVFHKIIKNFKPKLWLHGHVHLNNHHENVETTVENTRIVNVYGYKVIEYQKK